MEETNLLCAREIPVAQGKWYVSKRPNLPFPSTLWLFGIGNPGRGADGFVIRKSGNLHAPPLDLKSPATWLTPICLSAGRRAIGVVGIRVSRRAKRNNIFQKPQTRPFQPVPASFSRNSPYTFSHTCSRQPTKRTVSAALVSWVASVSNCCITVSNAKIPTVASDDFSLCSE